ncbi:Xaa-Pro dipeptidase, partial [Bienertia sinuspersici]
MWYAIFAVLFFTMGMQRLQTKGYVGHHMSCLVIAAHNLPGYLLLSSDFFLKFTFLQTFKDGDMALLDMGAEYHYYGSDITCSFPVFEEDTSIWIDVNGKFTDDQRHIYNAVLDAHDSVIAAMKPG